MKFLVLSLAALLLLFGIGGASMILFLVGESSRIGRGWEFWVLIFEVGVGTMNAWVAGCFITYVTIRDWRGTCAFF